MADSPTTDPTRTGWLTGSAYPYLYLGLIPTVDDVQDPMARVAADRLQRGKHVDADEAVSNGLVAALKYAADGDDDLAVRHLRAVIMILADSGRAELTED